MSLGRFEVAFAVLMEQVERMSIIPLRSLKFEVLIKEEYIPDCQLHAETQINK